MDQTLQESEENKEMFVGNRESLHFLLRHLSVVVPPAVIENTSGEGIWSGMIRTQPIRVTGRIMGQVKS